MVMAVLHLLTHQHQLLLRILWPPPLGRRLLILGYLTEASLEMLHTRLPSQRAFLSSDKASLHRRHHHHLPLRDRVALQPVLTLQMLACRGHPPQQASDGPLCLAGKVLAQALPLMLELGQLRCTLSLRAQHRCPHPTGQQLTECSPPCRFKVRNATLWLWPLTHPVLLTGTSDHTISIHSFSLSIPSRPSLPLDAAARAAAWQRHKAEQRAAVAAAAVSRELEECTFAPTINAASQRMSQARGRRSLSAPRGRSGAASASGAAGGYSDAHGLSGQSPSAATDSGMGAGGASIHERLYRATIAAHEPSVASGAVLGRLVDAPTAMLAGGGMQAADAGAPNMTRLAGAGGGPLMIAGGRGGPGSVGRPRSAGAASTAARFLHGGRPLFTSPATGSPSAAQRLDLHGAGAVAHADDPELRECTFKPRVNPVYDARPVKSRYRDVTPSATARRRAGAGASPTGSAAYGYGNGFGDDSYGYAYGGGGAGAAVGVVSASGKPLPLPTGLSECTFKPRTNPVDASAMPAAAMYVRAPIFERLARTQTQAQRDREKATLGGPAGDGAGPVGTGAGADDDAGIQDGGGSAASREERERRLAAFLARQNAALAKKQAHVLAIAAALAPPLQPQLCAKSIEMAEGARAGSSFLERVGSVTAKRQQEAAKMRARQAADPDCTFAPAINPASKALPGRGAVSLSRGDQLKRETALRLLRLRREAEALEGITFAPALNDNSRAVPGRLRVLAEPDSYIQRVAAEAAMAEHKARAQAEAAHAAELSECTFKPVVHEAPEYVKRIARSMALARAVRPPSSGPTRPDWK